MKASHPERVKDSSKGQLEIKFLGMPQIRYEGSELNTLPTTKAQALLLFMIHHHISSSESAIAKEQLTDIFWPGMPLSSALQNLRQTLYQIRKSLPEVNTYSGTLDTLIYSDRRTLKIHPEAVIRTDLDKFYSDAALAGMMSVEQMEQMVQFYQGPFLENFYVPMCPAFDEWIEQIRNEIRAKMIKSLQYVSEYFLEKKQLEKAKEYAQKLIQLDPYLERGNLLFIQSLREMGERNKAMQSYLEYEQLIGNELGIEPSTEMKALHEELKSMPSEHTVRSARGSILKKSVSNRNLIWAFGGAVLLLLIILIGVSNPFRNPQSGSGSIRIAVLPFENQTSIEYLAQGLTDDIIIKLSKVEGLSIISRQSSSQYVDTQKSPKEIGGELQVPYLLRGNIQEVEGQFKVNIQFVEAVNGEIKWAESFLRPDKEVFAFQNTVAQEVVHNLQNTFELEDDPEFASLPTSNTEAYNLYLKGRYRFYQAHPQALHQAVRLFEQALELDPDFHAARAWMAWTYASLAGSWGDENAEEMYPRVQEELARIADVPEMQGMYYKILGWTNLWLLDRDKAEMYLRKAAKVDPNEEFGLSGLALVLTLRRNFEEAQSVAKQGLSINPHFFWNYFVLAQSYYYDRNFDRAIAVVDTALQLFANHQASIGIKGNIYTYTGEPQKAINYLTIELNRQGTRSASLLGDIGIAYVVLGEESLALSFAEELVGRHVQGEKYTAYFAAKIYAMLGQPDRALELLEEAYERRDNELNWIEVDFEFESLRDSPRFQALIDTLGTHGVEM